MHPSLFAALSTQVVRALRKIGMIDTEGSVILDPRCVVMGSCGDWMCLCVWEGEGQRTAARCHVAAAASGGPKCCYQPQLQHGLENHG